MQIVESSRGAAFDDLDNDGDIDIVVPISMLVPPSIAIKRKRSTTGLPWS
ncbi:MAG: hypothetical protein U0905_06125 [Pirellulales bacterium]